MKITIELHGLVFISVVLILATFALAAMRWRLLNRVLLQRPPISLVGRRLQAPRRL